MELNILMIDDHPPIIEGYKTILSFNTAGYKITTTVANSCEAAYTIITNTVNPINFDMVFIDVTLPPFLEKEIHSGEDLVPLVKTQFPETRIVILTSHTESFVLYRLIKESNPHGIIIKSDTAEEFLIAFETIMKGEKYYSETVRKQNLDIKGKNNFLDNYNRQIITLLSQGIKTKNLGDHLHLSSSAIDKRKAYIKEFFNIDKGTDEDILREARKQGFI